MSLTLSSTPSANGTTLSWTSTLTNAISKLSVIYYDQTDAASVIKTPLSAADIKNGLYEISATSLVQGKSYLFSLQGLDSANANIASNTATVLSPFAVAAPTLNSFVGTSNQIVLSVTNPTFAAGDTGLTGNAKICFVFIDAPERSPPVMFEVYKPYGQTSYTITPADNAGIVNEQIYEVAAYIIPDSTDTKHTQSALSNTIPAYASELPNAPTLINPKTDFTAAQICFYASNFGENSNWGVSWTAPSDQASWGIFNNQKVQANFYIKKVTDASYPVTPSYMVDVKTLTTGLQYVFTGMPVAEYLVQMSYTNDVGEGVKSNAISWYNYTGATAILNQSAVVDPSNQVINLSWSRPSNYATLVSPTRYYLVLFSEGSVVNQTYVSDLSATSYSYPIPAGYSGKNAFIQISLRNNSPYPNIEYETANWNSSPSPIVKIYSKNTSALATATAVAGNGQITFSWSQPTVVSDGNDRTANQARIVITQGGMSQTIEGTGGSYVYTATNGLIYSAVLYDEAISPLGATLVSTVGTTLSNLKPQDAPQVLSNFVSTPSGDRQITLSWSDVVGGQIDHFVYQVDSNPAVSTTSNSVVISGLTNGQSYTFTAFSVNSLGVNGTSSSRSAIPIGTPSFTNVVLGTSKSVGATFNPAGWVLQSYEIVGLAAAPQITDTVFLQSTAQNIASYTGIPGFATLTSYVMSFAFPASNSGNIATAIILLSATNPNTGVASTFYYNSLKP